MSGTPLSPEGRCPGLNIECDVFVIAARKPPQVFKYGRSVIFNERLTRDGLPFVNGVLKKKGLQSLVTFCHLKLGHEPTVALLDDLKAMGLL